MREKVIARKLIIRLQKQIDQHFQKWMRGSGKSDKQLMDLLDRMYSLLQRYKEIK